MNNLITRYTSASQLGLISVKLDLLGNTILALARDGVRLAVLRMGSKGRGGAWMVLPMTVVIGAVCCGIALRFTTEPALTPFLPQYRQAISLYFLATILESLAEPSTIELISNQRMKEKVMIESMALMTKVAVVLKEILGANNELDLGRLMTAFSRGQVIYAFSLNLFHLINTKSLNLPDAMPSKEFISLASALTRQTFFKYFLSQGDMFIIGYFSVSLRDQGIYAVVSNYGSLVLRMVMQPVEEASLQYFSRELAEKAKVSEYFNLMLKTMIYLGLVFICYASFFTDVVIAVVLGKKWTLDNNAANALSAYCYLVGAAGVSGFLESLVHAMIEGEWMGWQRKASIMASMGYCALAVTMIRVAGSVGLIAASSINFMVRAVTNAFIIHKYNQKLELNIWQDGIRIPSGLVVTFGIAYLVNMVMFLFMREEWKLRMAVAVALFTVNTSALIKYDRKFVERFIKHWFK